MNIKIITLEKHRDKGLQEKEEDYIKRLRKFNKVSFDVIKRPKIHDAASPRVVCAAEGEMIMQKVKPSDFLVVLDSRGTMCSSEVLAETVALWQQQGFQGLVFVIGGPHGIDDTVKQRANYQLSLSRLTFGHEIARLLLCEVLYRSFDILHGGNYHK